MEKPTSVKQFVVLKKHVQNIILLTINQNQPNILLITKDAPSCGVFQKKAEHAKTKYHTQIKTITKQKGGCFYYNSVQKWCGIAAIVCPLSRNVL